MASVADYRPPSGTFSAQLPHRKPVPQGVPSSAATAHQRPPSTSHIMPDHERFALEQQQQQRQRRHQQQQQQHQPQLPSQPQPHQYQQPPYQQPQRQQPPYPQSGAPLTHARSRTSSSSIFPTVTAAPQAAYNPPPQQQQQQQQQQNAYPQQYQQQQQQQNPYPPTDRRTMSIATTSTTLSSMMSGTTVGGQPANLHRSVSARSGNSPLSYVALMRKQKATVWCERAQPEDPTVVRQQKMARERALREVASGNAARYSASSNISGGGFTSKIRHHAPKAQVYNPSSLPGSGVPMRLSANEVDEDDSDEDSRTRSFHQRTGSERSSLGSAGRMSSQFPASNTQGSRLSTGGGGTPPGGLQGYSPSGSSQHVSGTTPATATTTAAASTATAAASGNRNSGSIEDETPVPDQYKRKDYFSQAGGGSAGMSAGSSSSGETGRENSFGGLGQMPQKQQTELTTKASGMESEDIKRRGSVDDRTMTMSGFGKLFVANPDVD